MKNPILAVVPMLYAAAIVIAVFAGGLVVVAIVGGMLCAAVFTYFGAKNGTGRRWLGRSGSDD
jgi:hypothetical protein